MPLQAVSQLVSCCRQVSKYFAWAFSAENLFSHDQTQCCCKRGSVVCGWEGAWLSSLAWHGQNVTYTSCGTPWQQHVTVRCLFSSVSLPLSLSHFFLALPFSPFPRFNYVINKKFEKCSSNHFALLPFTYCLMTFDVANEWMRFSASLCVSVCDVCWGATVSHEIADTQREIFAIE